MHGSVAAHYGRPRLLELARLAGAHAGDRVLDLGGGIGGPARVLAAQFGCTVTVVDLTPDYCSVGEALLALHDIVAGPRQPIRFPVPWAATPELSHLHSAETMREAVLGAGFRVREWRDVTPPTLVWVRERLAAGGAGPLGVHLHLGERFRPAFETLARNLEEDRVRVVEALFEGPA